MASGNILSVIGDPNLNMSHTYSPAKSPELDLRPIASLCSQSTERFVCPACVAVDSLRPRHSTDEWIETVCTSCKALFRLIAEYPAKKIVYLDQWFVSDVVRGNNIEATDRLVNLLRQLVSTQQVLVVMSDINVHETAKGQIFENVKARYDEFYSLTAGKFIGVSKNPFDRQLQRATHGGKQYFPWTDCFAENPNSWLSIDRALTVVPYGLLNLERRLQRPNLNDDVIALMDKQLAQLSQGVTEEQIFSYTKEQCQLEMRDAVACARMFRRIGSAVLPASLSRPAEIEKAAFASYLLTLNRTVSEAEFQEILAHLEQCDFESLPLCTQISAAFDATRLSEAYKAKRASGDFSRGKKFNAKYGVSALNDAAHIAKFSPYVDYMLVDSKTDALLKSSKAIAPLLRQLRCSFHSHLNLDDPCTKLQLLVEQQLTHDQKLANRLYF